MKYGMLLGLFALLLVTVQADEKTEERAARLAELKKLADGLHYQSGEIVLGKDLAKLNLSDEFLFLSPEEAETVLVKLWGNPPNETKSLGLLVPKDFHPLKDDTWAVEIHFSDDGYIKDDDAHKINYTDLLKNMKEEAREASADRVKQGYPAIELVGWAAPPRYDAATHKMYWAKEIKFGQETGANTLNYNLRILGRGGVLILNAIASMPQLPEIEKATPTMLGMIDFTEGNRYADYKPGVDKTATYGLAALVAGGVAAKTGLLKGLWIAILALKKFIIIGVVALGAWIKKIFNTKIAGTE